MISKLPVTTPRPVARLDQHELSILSSLLWQRFPADGPDPDLNMFHLCLVQLVVCQRLCEATRMARKKVRAAVVACASLGGWLPEQILFDVFFFHCVWFF